MTTEKKRSGRAHVLRRFELELHVIVTLALNMPFPLKDEDFHSAEWRGLNNALKEAINKKYLKAKFSGAKPDKDAVVQLPDLEAYAAMGQMDDVLPGLIEEWTQNCTMWPPPKQRDSLVNAERKCQRWLSDQMNAGSPSQKKSHYRKEAQKKFSGLSKRAFDRSWANAIAKTGNTDWSKSGPKCS